MSSPVSQGNLGGHQDRSLAAVYWELVPCNHEGHEAEDCEEPARARCLPCGDVPTPYIRAYETYSQKSKAWGHTIDKHPELAPVGWRKLRMKLFS